MVFGRLLGKTIVDTQYSFGELVRRLHMSTEYLNKYIKEHDANSNPMQRATILGKILFQMLRFNILSKKLVVAYLKMARSNIDNVSAYFVNNPQPQEAIDGTYKQISKNLREVVEEESRERDKSHYLRMFANDLMHKAEASAKRTKKSIKAKSAQMQKQLELKDLRTAADVKNLKTEKISAEDEKRRRLEQWRRMEALRRAGALGEREKVRR